MVLRKLESNDISSLLQLEKEAYLSELLETERGFLRKMEIFPEGCICCEDNGEIRGFAISHPWRGEEEVEIDAHDLLIPDKPDCYYIHDLVVERKYRGTGLAGLLVKHLLDVARAKGLSILVLVAVQNSEPFWAQYGFRPVRKLSYGLNVPATYMRCVIR